MVNISKTGYSNPKEKTTNLSREVMRIFKKEVELDLLETSPGVKRGEKSSYKRERMKMCREA